MNIIELIVMYYFMLDKQSYEALDNSSSKDAFHYIVFMLIFGPIILGVSLATSLNELLNFTWLSAIAIATAVVIVIAATDRYFVVQRIKSQSPNAFKFGFFALRGLTISIMFFLAVSVTANMLGTSIDAHIATEVEHEKTELIKQDTQMLNYQEQLTLAQEKQARYDTLVSKMHEHEEQANKFSSDMSAEESGVTLSGEIIAEGRGKRYYANENGRDLHRTQATNISAEIEHLNYDSNEISEIQNNIKNRDADITAEVNIRHGGTLNRISYLYDIVKEDVFKLVYFIFTMIIATIIEITYTMALSSLPLNTTLRSMFDIQTQRELARLHAVRHEARKQLQDEFPTHTIDVPKR